MIILSWDSLYFIFCFVFLQEVLLLKASFSNDVKSRRVILYLKDSVCGEKYYKEKAACTVKSFLRSVTLKECSVDFSIMYVLLCRVFIASFFAIFDFIPQNLKSSCFLPIFK